MGCRLSWNRVQIWQVLTCRPAHGEQSANFRHDAAGEGRVAKNDDVPEAFCPPIPPVFDASLLSAWPAVCCATGTG